MSSRSNKYFLYSIQHYIYPQQVVWGSLSRLCSKAGSICRLRRLQNLLLSIVLSAMTRLALAIWAMRYAQIAWISKTDLLGKSTRFLNLWTGCNGSILNAKENGDTCSDCIEKVDNIVSKAVEDLPSGSETVLFQL